jgi:cysteine desulfurase/selenocysteine lyase
MFDPAAIRAQFPILQRSVHEKPLVYLDNAATTQKPQAVLDAILNYYTQHNANVHRGVHTLSDESTEAFLSAHERVAKFFGAQSQQLLFTRNTTEAMNHLAWGWRRELRAGDVIVTSLQDHHSSLVPWQQVALERGAQIVTLQLAADGAIDLENSLVLLNQHIKKIKVIALPLVSNVLGTLTPICEITEWLEQKKVRDHILCVVDAAQAAPHIPVSLAEFHVDALVFSGHKLYGPMGAGGAIVAPWVLEKLQPTLTGGGMIDTVTTTSATFSEDMIDRFTAGTPDVASLVGLAAALDWLEQWTAAERLAHEHDLMQYAWQKLSEQPAVTLIGPPVTSDPYSRIGVIAWVYDRVHAHDVAQVLDRSGVAVRSGHHCTMPLHTAMHWQATSRASVALYNTRADIDALIEGLTQVSNTFGRK